MSRLLLALSSLSLVLAPAAARADRPEAHPSAGQSLPANYRLRLQREFGCQGNDFDVVQCGRKAITARCQAWAGNYLQCPQGAQAAAAARHCVGGSQVDAPLWQALQGYDAAAAAAKKTPSCTKELGKAAHDMPGTYLANSCIAYDPKSPRGTWLTQVRTNCENVGRTVETTRCSKSLSPQNKRAFEMSLQSARVGVNGCRESVGRGQAAAAGEWICKAANNVVHAKMVCDNAR